MDQKLWDYLLDDTYEGDRLQLTHKIFKNDFIKIIEKLLDEWNFAKSLQTSNGAKANILDVGCAEGLFMHDLAEVLEARGLMPAAELIGFDNNVTAITTAEEFAKVSNPPRPYLQFVLHDATLPFEENPALRSHAKSGFDLIYALATLELLPQARVQLQRLYDYLKPGGLLYVRCIVVYEGEKGWQPIHPALAPLSRIVYSQLEKINPGADVANAVAAWLQEAGAEKVETIFYQNPVGGPTEIGRLTLRNSLLAMRNRRNSMIKQGLISGDQYDAIMDTIYRELSVESQGQIAAVVTLARKPA